jgi:imidazole glycerol-phosphate synthase subunit HisH
MKVDIVDVGCGNTKSIKNWLESKATNVKCVQHIDELEANLLVLPGVGSAKSYMEKLQKSAFDLAIIDHVKNGGRLIGICLGFQIMSSSSEEDGGVTGLGLIDAEVERLEGGVSHNGWETLSFRKDRMNGQTFFSSEKLNRKKVLSGRVFYNHEYGVINKDVCAFNVPVSMEMCRYSGMFVKNKIIGIQFHPEKSQFTGLDLISMIL